MPIIDISGLRPEEADAMDEIEEGIKAYFTELIGLSSPDHVMVTFFTNERTKPNEHVMARLISKYFWNKDQKHIDEVCWAVVEILETAGHPYNEAFPLHALAMSGRELK